MIDAYMALDDAHLFVAFLMFMGSLGSILAIIFGVLHYSYLAHQTDSDRQIEFINAMLSRGLLDKAVYNKLRDHILFGRVP